MKSVRCLQLIPALLCLSVAHSITAAEDESEKLVKKLIAELSHDDFNVRQEAAAGLIAVGPAAQPALAQTLKETTDEETKAQIKEIEFAIPIHAAMADLAKGDAAKVKAAIELLQMHAKTSATVREKIRTMPTRGEREEALNLFQLYIVDMIAVENAIRQYEKSLPKDNAKAMENIRKAYSTKLDKQYKDLLAAFKKYEK